MYKAITIYNKQGTRQNTCPTGVTANARSCWLVLNQRSWKPKGAHLATKGFNADRVGWALIFFFGEAARQMRKTLLSSILMVLLIFQWSWLPHLTVQSSQRGTLRAVLWQGPVEGCRQFHHQILSLFLSFSHSWPLTLDLTLPFSVPHPLCTML